MIKQYGAIRGTVFVKNQDSTNTNQAFNTTSFSQGNIVSKGCYLHRTPAIAVFKNTTCNVTPWVCVNVPNSTTPMWFVARQKKDLTDNHGQLFFNDMEFNYTNPHMARRFGQFDRISSQVTHLAKGQYVNIFFGFSE